MDWDKEKNHNEVYEERIHRKTRREFRTSKESSSLGKFGRKEKKW